MRTIALAVFIQEFPNGSGQNGGGWVTIRVAVTEVERVAPVWRPSAPDKNA
jgi:hypothetical protein